MLLLTSLMYYRKDDDLEKHLQLEGNYYLVMMVNFQTTNRQVLQSLTMNTKKEKTDSQIEKCKLKTS